MRFFLVVLLLLRLNQSDGACVNAIRDQGKEAEHKVPGPKEQDGREVQLVDDVENLHIATSPHGGEMPHLADCQAECRGQVLASDLNCA